MSAYVPDDGMGLYPNVLRSRTMAWARYVLQAYFITALFARHLIADIKAYLGILEAQIPY